MAETLFTCANKKVSILVRCSAVPDGGAGGAPGGGAAQGARGAGGGRGGHRDRADAHPLPHTRARAGAPLRLGQQVLQVSQGLQSIQLAAVKSCNSSLQSAIILRGARIEATMFGSRGEKNTRNREKAMAVRARKSCTWFETNVFVSRLLNKKHTMPPEIYCWSSWCHACHVRRCTTLCKCSSQTEQHEFIVAVDV